MMGFQQAKENLARLIAKFEREAEAGKIREYNEEAAKTAFIQPFLKDVLGWDVNDRDEVSPEEKVSRGRVDYGLKVEGKIKIFIEAKPPRADLTKYTEQAVRYGYNRKGVPFVLLTDFEGLKLYDVTFKPDIRNPQKGCKIDLSWRQYLDEFDRVWLLSKESALQGKLDQLLLIKPKERIPVDKAILDDLKEWREILAKDIYKNNPQLFHSGEHEKDADYLKEITQRILDRIIFMRSCEDRGLIHRRPLKELFEERTETVGTNTMIFLAEEFKHYNIIFDSDIFRPQEWEAGLAIDFKVMKAIILETYNPYQFDVIPLEVLGNIYEQYLGYTIRLTDHQVKYELKPEVRKAGGVYYTPEYIVDYIVKNTVGKLLEESSTRKTKKLRILDPACGSGSFLIRAYEEMLNYYAEQKKKKLKAEGKQKKLDLGEEEGPRLTIHEKSAVLKEHIYGVDIDEQAVEVTKLSLMLKMLEGEYGIIPGRAILPMLDKNIKCGNSLISGDTLEMKKYFGDDWYKIKPFNWEDEFPKIMKDEGGFDAVIGNPPYGAHLSEEEINHLLVNYKLQNYQLDTYILLFERGLDLIKAGGLFGMIMPNTWLINLQYNRIRRHVFNMMKIQEIVHYFRPVFLKATVDTEIVIVRKTKPNVSHKFKITIVYKRGIIKSYNILQSRWQTREGKPVNILEHPEFFNLADKLKKATKLDEICVITQGAKPFQVGKGKPPQTRKIVSEKPFVSNIQQNPTFRPLLRGSLINRYKILWKDDYWISFGDWLAEPRYSLNYDAPSKIVIRQTGDSLIATLDSSQFIVRDNLYTIVSREKNLDLRYVLGLLNSSLLNWFYQTILNPEKGEALAQIKRGHLSQLPIVLPNISNQSEYKLHDKLVELVDVMLDLNKKIQFFKGSKTEQIQRQIERTDKEIDEIVYKLYEIAEEEKKIIEGKG